MSDMVYIPRGYFVLVILFAMTFTATIVGWVLYYVNVRPSKAPPTKPLSQQVDELARIQRSKAKLAPTQLRDDDSDVT